MISKYVLNILGGGGRRCKDYYWPPRVLLLLWAALELKSHPLKPISYFCGVVGPLNLTPSSLFLISAAAFGAQILPRITSLHLCTYFTSQYLFLPKGLFSVFLLLSPYFHTPAFQNQSTFPFLVVHPPPYLAPACPLRLKPPYLFFLLPCCGHTPAFQMPSPT